MAVHLFQVFHFSDNSTSFCFENDRILQVTSWSHGHYSYTLYPLCGEFKSNFEVTKGTRVSECMSVYHQQSGVMWRGEEMIQTDFISVTKMTFMDC